MRHCVGGPKWGGAEDDGSAGGGGRGAVVYHPGRAVHVPPAARWGRGNPFHALADHVEPVAAVLTQCGGARGAGVTFPATPPGSVGLPGPSGDRDKGGIVEEDGKVWVVLEDIREAVAGADVAAPAGRHSDTTPDNAPTWGTTALMLTVAAAVPPDRVVYKEGFATRHCWAGGVFSFVWGVAGDGEYYRLAGMVSSVQTTPSSKRAGHGGESKWTYRRRDMKSQMASMAFVRQAILGHLRWGGHLPPPPLAALPDERGEEAQLPQWQRQLRAHTSPVPTLASSSPLPIRVLLYTRADANYRVWVNTTGVEAAIAALPGVTLTTLRSAGGTPLAAQAATFASADVYVAAHGGATVNALFLPSDGAVVEVWRCCWDADLSAAAATAAAEGGGAGASLFREWSGPYVPLVGLALTYLPCTEVNRAPAPPGRRRGGEGGRSDGSSGSDGDVGGGENDDRVWMADELTPAELAAAAAGTPPCRHRTPRWSPASVVVPEEMVVGAVGAAVRGVRQRRGAAAAKLGAEEAGGEDEAWGEGDEAREGGKEGKGGGKEARKGMAQAGGGAGEVVRVGDAGAPAPPRVSAGRG